MKILNKIGEIALSAAFAVLAACYMVKAASCGAWFPTFLFLCLTIACACWCISTFEQPVKD